MNREEILNRAKLLDEAVYTKFVNNPRYQIVIVGGGALVLQGYIYRATYDIDVLKADDEIYTLMYDYDLNGNVNAYLDYFPFNYEKRIELVWVGKIIDFYTASLEDIVISKLCSDRDKDKEDLVHIAQFIDWEILESLIHDENEIKLRSWNNSEYLKLLDNYINCMEKFKQ